MYIIKNVDNLDILNGIKVGDKVEMLSECEDLEMCTIEIKQGLCKGQSYCLFKEQIKQI